MRRILFAALFALTLHVLLLTIKPDRFKRNPVQPLKSEPITLTFSYIQPEIHPKPVLRIPERPREKPIPVEKKPVKRVVIKKKPKKKRITPVEKKPLEREPVVPDPPEPVHFSEPISPEPVEVLNQEPAMDEMKETSKGKIHAEAKIQGHEEQIEASQPPPPRPLKEASPMYKENPAPGYPKTARRRGFEGTVILEVLVNTLGRVDDLRVHQSSGYQVLDRAAMNSVKNWLFEPAKRGDQEIEMWVKVPVRFELK